MKGFRVDEAFLKDYSRQLEGEAKISEDNVYELAGLRFNLASPKQLGEVLFEKLKLDPKARKTKRDNMLPVKMYWQSLQFKTKSVMISLPLGNSQN
jgi:DNA polymerase I-like protein with 3'-5' exonuclease and polymerase domains